MSISFPSSPSLYDEFSSGSRTWRWNGAEWELSVLPFKRVVHWIIDGGGLTISQGTKLGYITVPETCSITKWRIMAVKDSVSGTATLDVYKDTFANFPPTSADSIISLSPAKPTIASGSNATAESTAISAWSVTLDEGDVITISVDDVTDISWLNLELFGSVGQ